MTKTAKSDLDAIAHWDPYETPPPGVRVENLRRRGVDAMRFYLEVPSRTNQLLYCLPFLLGVPVIALSIYVFWLKLAGVAGAFLLVYYLKVNRSGLTKRWTISLTPEYLGVIAETGKESTSFSKRIDFEDIKGIEVRKELGKSTTQLIIKTQREKILVGHGLSNALTKWLKNYLVLELAGLSWRPIFGVNRSQSKLRSVNKHNPLLLDQDLAIRLIDIFVAQAPDFIEQLGEAVAARDAGSIRKAAHWLKAASANVGAKPLSEQCQLMQLYAMDHDYARIDILFEDIKTKSDDVVSWLTDIRQNAATTIAEAGSGNVHPADLKSLSAGKPKAEPSDEADDSNIIDAKVLVVDDSEVSRLIAEDCLGQVVSHIEFAADGGQALDELAKGRFDLILSDCEMAGIDGYEFARRMREYERTTQLEPTPIIALTAHALKRDRARCIAAGMNDYLSKPFSYEELEDKVRMWLPDGPLTSADDFSGSGEGPGEDEGELMYSHG